jgi:hypothetical protein
MSIKVLAGDWEPGTVCVFEGALFGRPDRIRMGRIFGAEYSAEEVASIELITEQNSTSILGKAGWGFLGSVALGPLGMFAGLLGGGNRHDKIVAFELTNGKRALLQCDTKSYGEIMRLVFKKKADAAAPDVPTALPDTFRRDAKFQTAARHGEAPAQAAPDFMKGIGISFGKADGK